MAAKTSIFAIAAVLCAVAAATAIPLFHNNEDTKGLHHLGLPIMAVQREMSLNPKLKFQWTNIADIIKRIQEAMTAADQKVHKVTEEALNAAREFVDKIEDNADQVAAKWRANVQKWVHRAVEARVDVQECLYTHEGLSHDVANVIKGETRRCVGKHLADLDEALENVKALEHQIENIVIEAKDKVAECMKKNIFAAGVCLVTGLSKIDQKAVKLLSTATLRVVDTTAKIAEVGSSATICAASATLRHSPEVKTLVEDTISCIRNKLRV